VRVPWMEIDLSNSPPEDRPGRLERLMEDDRIARFDLQIPPLLRFLLVKIGEAHNRLVLSVHHILLDGWSMPLLVGELLALYASGGYDSALPTVRPFRDHLAWLSTQDQAAASAAWAQALKGIEGPTLLAVADRSRPPVMPEQVHADISEDLTSRLTSLARAQGLTLNTLVQVAWAMVLSRSVGRLDVVFGATVSGRPAELAGVESMLGLFINTVPVRVRLDPAESLVHLLHRIQDEQSRLLDHQHLGLTEVQREVGVDTLFDTLIIFESYPLDIAVITRALEGTGVTLTETESRDSTHYPISLMALPGTRLQITLKYRPDLFDSSTVRVLADRVARVLETMVVDPDIRVGEVDVLSTPERHQLLIEWNDNSVEVPFTSLPGLFEQQVARTPDATAVMSDGVSLDYVTLNKQANQLARQLIEHGAGPEQLVALALPRSVDLIVALLAVLKSGAAYLPIDLSYPADRIRFMLADADPMLVLTASKMTEQLPPNDILRVVLDEDDTRTQLSAYPDTDIEEDERHHVPSLSNPAYVIYTSGSTGRPKGVVVLLGGLENFLAAMRELLTLSPDDRLLAVTTVGFDIANLEIFVPLISGATVVLANRDVAQDPSALSRTIASANVSVMQATPSLWRGVAAEGVAELSDVRVLVGGEALPADLGAGIK
jgi:non-ribosomal peptide synthetase component F